ncbi:MAG: hypothetical protein KDB56_14880 [Mycobacterium sp.]|nr:hypothetical protein [Mycobacterium sp.]
MTGFGNDPSSTDRNWTTYDSFLAAADGTSPISGTYVWDATYTPNLTGADGGLYFAGPERSGGLRRAGSALHPRPVDSRQFADPP